MQPFLIRVMVDRVDADLHGVVVDLTTRTSQTFGCVEQLIEILRSGAGESYGRAVISDEAPAPTSAEFG